AGADIGSVDTLGDEASVGEGGRGVPHGGSKFVNMIPALMIMDMNDDDYDYGSHRDSAPAPDNAGSQHTASLRQVIVTILGASAVLCFA
ncbi:hypothetical protein Tco_0744259, partial [Tanacetum coccineum]